MAEFVVDFTVNFSVVIDAENEKDAKILADDDDWREEVLDTRTVWEGVVVETDTFELEEE